MVDLLVMALLVCLTGLGYSAGWQRGHQVGKDGERIFRCVRMREHRYNHGELDDEEKTP